MTQNENYSVVVFYSTTGEITNASCVKHPDKAQKLIEKCQLTGVRAEVILTGLTKKEAALETLIHKGKVPRPWQNKIKTRTEVNECGTYVIRTLKVN